MKLPTCFTSDGKHIGELVDVTSYRVDYIIAVVRWCPVCGAIVVDGESDGRLYPGRLMNMRFPSIVKKEKE
jgi:hypothetical protein